MASITIEVSGPIADKLRRLAEIEQRSELEIVRDALEVYAPAKRRLPKGAGKYRSGQSDVSKRDEEILREAIEEAEWP